MVYGPNFMVRLVLMASLLYRPLTGSHQGFKFSVRRPTGATQRGNPIEHWMNVTAAKSRLRRKSLQMLSRNKSSEAVPNQGDPSRYTLLLMCGTSSDGPLSLYTFSVCGTDVGLATMRQLIQASAFTPCILAGYLKQGLWYEHTCMTSAA